MKPVKKKANPTPTPSPSSPYCGCRKLATAVTRYLDDRISDIVSELQNKNMWDNTLLLFTSDNGASINHRAGTNNYPLRGGKNTPWEGGIRVPAFVSGGFLPLHVRGTSLNALTHIADWYTTFITLAHGDPVDHRAARVHLPPVDGMNLWPLLSGQTTKQSRRVIPIDRTALIQDRYKLYLGHIGGSSRTGPIYPNSTRTRVDHTKVDCSQGCLYDVVNDPSEYYNIRSQQPTLLKQMTKRLKSLRSHFVGLKELSGPVEKYYPKGSNKDNICKMSDTFYHGSLGPWLNITNSFLKQLK